MVLVVSCGCATTAIRFESSGIPDAPCYPATLFDSWLITENWKFGECREKVYKLPLLTLDLIPSIVTDTVLLPIDLIKYHKYSKEFEPKHAH